MSDVHPLLAVRASSGISINLGSGDYEQEPSFKKDESKTCRCMRFSPEGDYFIWVNGSKVILMKTSNWEIVVSLDKPRVQDIHFSPKGTYFALWELYSWAKDKPKEILNLGVYKSSTGELLRSFEQKRQENWQPQWTHDEVYCTLNNKSTILFYKSEMMEDKAEICLAGQKVYNYSLSPMIPSYFLLCYVPGQSGQPSICKLFQHADYSTPIAAKTFFEADRVEMYWNKKGNSVLFMTSVDVDKTGSSYYGNQHLYFITTKGLSSLIQLNKPGPIHAVQWSPQSHEFCVIYGFMPAETMVFNNNGEPVFELGEGPRNSIYYSPHGNILLLGGFGNLQGSIELWEAPTRKFINKAKAADTTLLSWSPDGAHFLTATTAPRLRMCNGYKIWNHSGKIIHEKLWNKQEELWEVIWQNFPQGSFKPPVICYEEVKNSISNATDKATVQAYRPPTARGIPSSFKLNAEVVDLTPGSVAGVKGQIKSKAALKAKKNREAKKANKIDDPVVAQEITELWNDLKEYNSTDPEKNKKISKIKTKLIDIQKLKEQKKSGKQMHKNQLDKIDSEDELMKMLKELSVS